MIPYILSMAPRSHTPPLFHQLKILNLFDIHKLQVGKLVYECLNFIRPTPALVKFTQRSSCIILDTLAKVIIIIHLQEQLDVA